MKRKTDEILRTLLPGGPRYSLGGLRGGGATLAFLVTDSVAYVQRRGRWGSAKTLDHYVQESVAAMTMNAWPPVERERIFKLAATLPPLFSGR